jgi:hypothetical protein
MRFLAVLALAVLATAAEAVPVPQYVWVHPATTDMFAMTMLYSTERMPEHFERITGRTGMMSFPLRVGDQAQLVAILDGVGRATCDSVEGDSQPWEVTRIETTPSGGLRKGASHRVTYGALRCTALAAMTTLPDTSRVYYALRQLAALKPVPTPRQDLPVFSGSWLAIEKVRKKDDLIKDAEDLNSRRDWSRVGFAVWTAHAADGRGVRLVSGPVSRLDEDPAAPTDVRVSASVLREVIAKFLGRREIEIASHYPIEESMRDGVTGWAGAVECDSLRSRTWVVFGSYIVPSEGVAMGRELVEYLSVRDRKASQAVEEALALAQVAAPRKAEPTALRGPLPFAIRVSPTTGEDLARPLVVVKLGAPDSLFADSLRYPDPELFLRGNSYKGSASDRAMAAIAAQLDQAAIDDGAPCDSLAQYPAWPPTWRVRYYGADGRVARDFNVKVRTVRCHALERYDALGKSGNPEMRSAMQMLVHLGVDEWAPDPPNSSPPQRFAPEAQRAAFLAGPVAALRLSLVGSNGRTVRLSAEPVLTAKAGEDDVIHLADDSMRAALASALSHPAFVTGMARTLSELPRRQPHAEIRVLERYPGLRSPVLRLIAYVSPADAAEITQRILAAVDPAEAGAIRARIEGTDR